MTQTAKIDGRYQVRKTLGAGLSGEVLLVSDSDGEKALKFLKKVQLNVSREEALNNFKNEFSILKELNHPNISRILDFGFDPTMLKYYFTTEFVSGRQIDEACVGQPFETKERLIVQVLRALNYLHARGIYHFDIKPQNVLVAYGPDDLPDQAKLIDFGLAGFSASRKKVGTPAYMAPEVVQGGHLDGRVDLYSFGVVIYKILTGTNPFIGKNLKETMENQVSVTPPPPSQVNPEVPTYWDHIIDRLLEKNPANRYSQASLAIRDLNYLSNKKFEIETRDTKLSYLPEKGALIGREEEWGVFTRLFGEVFLSDRPTGSRLLVVSGAKGMGKSRLLSEMKSFSQLRNVPVKNLPNLDDENSLIDKCLVLVDEAGSGPDAVNAAVQQMSRGSCLVVWATEEAPKNWTDAKVVELKPYTRVELRQYLESVTGLTRAPDKLIDEVSSRTQGNPLFVTEFVKALLDQDMLYDESGKWDAKTFEDIAIDFDRISITTTVEDSLREKYSQHTNHQRMILEWLAVNGNPITIVDFESLCELSDFKSEILGLINEDIIEKSSQFGRENAYWFKNRLLADVIVKSLNQNQLRTMHDRLAKIFVDRPRDRQTWLYHAGRGSDVVLAKSSLLQSAMANMKAAEISHAIADLQLYFALPVNTEIDRDSDFQASLALAQAYLASRKFAEATDLLQKLLINMGEENAPGILEKRLEARRHLVEAALKRLDFAAAEQECAQASLELVKSVRQKIWHLTFENYRAYICLKRGEVDEARKAFLATYQIWEKELTAEDQKQVVNNRLFDVYQLTQEYDQVIDVCLKNIEVLHNTDQPFWLATNYYVLADVCFRLITQGGRTDKTDLAQKCLFYFETCEAIARDIGNYSYMLRSFNGIGNLYDHQKQPEKAVDFYHRALAIARKIGELETAATIAFNIVNILIKLGKLKDAYSHVVYALNTFGSFSKRSPASEIHFYLCYLSLVDIHLGENDATKAHAALDKADAVFAASEFAKPYDFWRHIRRASAYQLDGNSSQAQAELEIARQLALSPEEKNELKEAEKKIKVLPEQPAGELRVIESPTRAGMAQADDIRKIIEINRIINSEHEFDQLLKLVLNYAVQLTGAESGFVLLADEAGQVVVKASLNASDDDRNQISQSIVDLAVRGGEIIRASNASDEKRFDSADSIVLNELKSVLCLPITSKNRAIGAFYLDNRYRSNAFAEYHEELLLAFCDQVGIALEHTKIIGELKSAQGQLQDRLEKTSRELDEAREILKQESEVYKTRYSYSSIVTQSPRMIDVFRLLDKVTETTLSVFLYGESGTGKELAAKALHYNNPARAEKRFLAVNCGAIPTTLMESELFGHKAGSFTGAMRDKKGIFEEADGGTLFLDEIAELPLELQVKLLRVLQEGEVQRVGESDVRKVDVRVICASHHDLEKRVRSHLFREDLYYRVCQMKITLPPLRERREDIAFLAKHFVHKYCELNHIAADLVIPSDFLKSMIEYDWPGNVRELENLISVACALQENESLSLAHLPDQYGIKKIAQLSSNRSLSQSTVAGVDSGRLISTVSIDEHNRFDPSKTWADYEAVIIAKCLQSSNGRKKIVGERLGLSHSTVYKKTDELGLDDANNLLFLDPFIYDPKYTLKDYIEKIFIAALRHHDDHPYAAIRQLNVSQGYYYKIVKPHRESAVIAK